MAAISPWRLALIASLLGLSTGLYTRHGSSARTLHVRREEPRSSKFELPAPSIAAEDAVPLLKRFVRDASHQVSPSLRPNSTMALLHDSHSLLVVHWAGKDSQVILALAKNPHGSGNTSNIFVSRDYGRSFASVLDKMQRFVQQPVLLENYYNTETFNGRYVFTDIVHNCIFTTTDYGETFNTFCNLTFSPKKILLKENNPDVIVGYDQDSTDRYVFISLDFGFSWRTIPVKVKVFFWDAFSNDTVLYVEEERLNNNAVLRVEPIRSYGGLVEWRRSEVISGVAEFEIHEEYMFVTKETRVLGNPHFNTRLSLHVSRNNGPFVEAQFPSRDLHDFFVADASEGQVMVCAVTGNHTTHLYISEVNGTRFSISLENIVYFNPLIHIDYWLRYISNESFADLYKVQGMRGIYIASQFTNNTMSMSNQRTVITYDKGGMWQRIRAPDYDSIGRPTNCSMECSLHLSQQFHHLYPGSLTTLILSHDSAPGLIVASGTLGNALKTDGDVFLSSDGGFTWRQILQGHYLYAFADHGGIIVATKPREPTNEVYYSWNLGETWSTHQVSEDNKMLRIYGVLTEPGETTTIFSIFGSYGYQNHSWLLVQLDTRNVLNTQCGAGDYSMWMPFVDNGCLLGSRVQFQRRSPHAQCFNGQDYDRVIVKETCPCSRDDYECDFGFEPDGASCRSTNSSFLHEIPDPCPPDTYYPWTRGYRKVAGDVCQGGAEHRYAPLQYSCPIPERPEFLLYTTRQSILRFDLTRTGVEELVGSGQLQDVTAVDFHYQDNCLYWAESRQGTIKRQCLNSTGEIEQIVGGGSLVQAIALDWTADTLFWLDAQNKSIAVATKDGRFQKFLIGAPHLDQPHALVLDPHHGYMYWTDHSPQNPHIGRAWMDGTPSSITILVNRTFVTSPQGLTLDLRFERLYWTDQGGIMTSDLNGHDVQVLVTNQKELPHPVSIGVYKDSVYWADWGLEAIGMVDKRTGRFVSQVLSGLRGISDLKVISHTFQQVRSACSQEARPCSQLCLPKPHPTDNAHFNRSCKCGDGIANAKHASGTGDMVCLCDSASANLRDCLALQHNCSAGNFYCKNSTRCIPSTWLCDHDNDCGDMSDERDCPYVPCVAGMFTCRNGMCITERYKCDFDDDCGDGSDEVGCSYPTCSANQFQCQNRRCISKNWQCDGDNDCRDNSDEQKCNHTVSCHSWEHTCRNGECVGFSARCDGRPNCADGSDELSCNVTCDTTRFKCHNNARCIFALWRCDGENDCGDNSDEVNCTFTPTPWLTTTSPRPSTCNYYQFTCANGYCVSITDHCDGINDCGDNSDELLCADVPERNATMVPPPASCPSNTFRCMNGLCISETYRCNSHHDCLDGSDEMDCGETRCTKDQFQCNSSSPDCIWNAWRCDGDSDCQFGEDEANCPSVARCGPDEFRCTYDGGCLPQSRVCDGTIDCGDQTDESYCGAQVFSTPTPSHCGPNFFVCQADLKCLLSMYVCDGTLDCDDGSDEQLPMCSRSLRVIGMEVAATDMSINISWLAPPAKLGNSGTYNYTVAYMIKDKLSTWNNITVSTTTFRIRNLQAATSYLLTVYVVQNGVTFGPIHPFIVNTTEGIPDPPTSFVVSHVPRLKSLLVQWRAPSKPRGRILLYKIYFEPLNKSVRGVQVKRHPVSDISDPSTDFQEYLMAGDLQENQKYQVYITASTLQGEGPPTNKWNLTFDSELLSSKVTNLTAQDKQENSISLSWNTVPKAQTYVVMVDIDYLKLIVSYNSSKNTFTVPNLCPGYTYSFTVQAVVDGERGLGSQPFIASTKGDPVMAPMNVVANQSVNNGPVCINFTSTEGLAHRIYLSEHTDIDMYRLDSIRSETTTKTKGNCIDNLLACEQYFIRVAVQNCPLSRYTTIFTLGDEKSPVKDLKYMLLNDTSQPYTSIKVTWQPPCSHDSHPLMYNLEANVTEHPLKLTVSQNEYNISGLVRGSTVTITVRTALAGSQTGHSLFVFVPPFPRPREMAMMPMNSTHVQLYWGEDPLDKPLPGDFTGFLVEVTSRFNTSFHIHQVVKVPSVVLALHPNDDYQFTVRYNKIRGYFGEPLIFNHPLFIPGNLNRTEPGALAMLQSNIVVIVVPVVAVAALVVLLVVLGVFVVRHRRLQRSFAAFASSHYDPRSGTTFFTAADELGEDEDTPMIQGFSDDEPLVIA